VVKIRIVTTATKKVTTMLTDPKCKNATSEGKAIRKLSDGDGLYLWVYADGRKYWRLRYWQSGKEKSLSLGVYPNVSLKEARTRWKAQRLHLDNNLDPAAERKAEKLQKRIANANSFEAVAEEWSAKQAHTWVANHALDVKRRLEKNIYPTIGRRPIAEISAPELLETLRKIEERGAHDLSHRVLSVCGQVFRYGIATHKCKSDISKDLRGALTPHKKRKQAAVDEKDLPALLRAIAAYDTIGDIQTKLALQLLALTFVRTNELIGAEWTEFDLEGAIWTIPAARMKMKEEHLVPLSVQAIAILQSLKEISGSSKFVFPGRSRDKPVSNNTMLFALYRLGYKGKMTGHGFRAVASTKLNETGFRADVIERQLAHGERDEVRAAYNRAQYLPERISMMQQWADLLDEIVKPASKVTSIYRRAS
jgi:integrase